MMNKAAPLFFLAGDPNFGMADSCVRPRTGALDDTLLPRLAHPRKKPTGGWAGFEGLQI